MNPAERQRKHRSTTTASILFAMAIIVVFLCYFMIDRSKNVIVAETQRYLAEMSQQISHKVNQGVENNMNILENLTSNMTLSQEDVFLGKFQDISLEESNFRWIGYLDEAGILYTQNQEPIDIASFATAKQVLQGDSAVSENMDTLFGEEGILYGAPYFYLGEQKGAIVGWVPIEKMQLLKDTDTFEGNGFSYIISENGNFIQHSENVSAVFKDKDVYESIEHVGKLNKNFSLDAMKEDIHQRKSGSLQYTVYEAPNGRNEERTLYYIPLQYGNWYLLSIAPSTIYANNISQFTRLSVTVNVTIFFMFLILVLYIIYRNNKFNKEMEDVAYVDPVTGGFTATRFDIELQKKLDHREGFSFISLDIRKFKLINDSFGSHDGNKVLQYTYECLKYQLHPSEYIARISADTYNMILTSVDAKEIKGRLETMAEQLNMFNGNSEELYYFPLDCGIYIVHEQDVDLDIISLRDRANTARKKNKMREERHLCSTVFYDDKQLKLMLKEKEMENRMEQALVNHEFQVYLQPKVSLQTNEVVGAEALIRWKSDGRLIPPMEFIPLFERNGFIVKLDHYVFEEVCKLQRNWLDEGKKAICISVNVSRNHLSNLNFFETYSDLQKRYAIPPELLEIELTETMVFENLDLLKTAITQIQQLGFQCSMDDFGSGYSSLNVLKEVPMKVLKIDRDFFSKAGDERGDDVVETVIELAKKLGMSIVAEGVETAEQVDFLRKCGCDTVQGYVFYKPMPVEEFNQFIK